MEDTSNILVSVIIPIYNVQEYLSKCLDSVIKQTYNKLDIILINDGSTDNSLEICNHYKAMDSRIRIISTPNRGLAAVRNLGIENAYGEVIAFVDSDDYIELNMYEKMVYYMKKVNADIVMCQYNKILVNGKKVCSTARPSQKIYKNCEIDKLLYESYNLCVVPWNKLYKKEILKTIRYPFGKKHEDNYVVHYILHNAKKMIVIEDVLYNYVKRQNSITLSRSYNSAMDEVGAVDDRILFYKENNMDCTLLRLAIQESIRKRIGVYQLLLKETKFQKDNRKSELISSCRQIIQDNIDILYKNYPLEFKIFVHLPLVGITINYIKMKFGGIPASAHTNYKRGEKRK